MLLRVGGNANLSQHDVACNTGDAVLFSNIRASTRRRLPHVRPRKPTKQIAVICGGGASLAGSLESIRILQATGAKVFALNNVARFLSEHGIAADAQILVDSRPGNARFVETRWAREAYLASQCSPEIYEAALKAGYKVSVYHGLIDGMLEHIYRNPLQSVLWAIAKRTQWQWLKDVSRVPELMGGGITVGLTGLSVVYALGHRDMHLYGYDSSHAEGRSHAYAQAENEADDLVVGVVDNREFTSSVVMATQAQEFMRWHDSLVAHGARITVHGEGLLPTLWRTWKRERAQTVLNAVYDLGLSPPTYDFIAFLIEAERHRIEKKIDKMDVWFQPGPWHGFRHDELPPDAATRKAMLWRVCAGMARLMPSVRNVMVLGERSQIGGEVFPVDYAEQHPKSHYGIRYLRGASQMLRASDSARAWAAKRYPARYATITMRESTYWPERNSNRPEWEKVAWWLSKQGIHAVFVEDTEKTGDALAFDIDLRAALYEGAVVNLGVSNGPMTMCPYLGAKYLIFNVGQVAAVHSATPEFLAAHGYTPEGEGMGGDGRMVWKADTAENIIAELQEFKSNVVPLKEKTS